MTPIAKQSQYAVIAKGIDELSAAQGKLLARLAEVESLLRTHTPDDGTTHVEAALKFAETGTTVVPANVPAELREEHVILRQQVEAVAKALRERQQTLLTVHGQLSGEACRDVGAAHRKLATRYLETLKQLDAIAEEELAMIRALEADGYSVNFREYVRWPVIGLRREKGEAAVSHKVTELQRYLDHCAMFPSR